MGKSVLPTSTKGRDNIKNLLVWLSGNLRVHRDDKEFSFVGKFSGANKVEIEIMKKLRFSQDSISVSKRLNRSEIRYWTGGWLEEFCFNGVSDFSW